MAAKVCDTFASTSLLGECTSSPHIKGESSECRSNDVIMKPRGLEYTRELTHTSVSES